MTSDTPRLWRHIYGDQAGYVCISTGRRAAPGAKLTDVKEAFYAYPAAATFAEGQIGQHDALGEEVYFSAHLLTGKKRDKKHAAPLHALYAELDAGDWPNHLPQPTAAVESSPGRQHGYFRLTRPVAPARGEELNRRLALALKAYGADQGGWDLSQLLRPPDTTNKKYADRPPVRLLWLREDRAYDPDEIDQLLPPAPQERPQGGPGCAAGGGLNGEEPPVRLDAADLAWWRGERVARKDAGDVDRSATLYAIARELAKANATARTIAAAIAERDVALEYRCYADRTDRDRRYAITAARALEASDATQPTFTFNVGKPEASPAPDAPGDTCPAALADAEAEIAELRSMVA